MCRIEGYSIGEWLEEITDDMPPPGGLDEVATVLAKLFTDNATLVLDAIIFSPKDFWGHIADDPPDWLQEMFDEVAAERAVDQNRDAKLGYDTSRGVYDARG